MKILGVLLLLLGVIGILSATFLTGHWGFTVITLSGTTGQQLGQSPFISAEGLGTGLNIVSALSTLAGVVLLLMGIRPGSRSGAKLEE